MSAVIAQWQEQVREAAAGGGLIEIRGGASKAFYGGPRQGQVLDTRAYQGVLSFEPSELVVSVRAGTPLQELEAVLAQAGQRLAFEPPHFGAATVGGMVAAGFSGPRRAQAGALRDYVLGVRVLDGRGDVLNFGGQVMKNVAGYDVSRLMAGAWGCLGLLLEVSLKLLPIPPACASLSFEFDCASALHALQRWGMQPWPISASCWLGGRLYLRLEGASAAVRAACAALGGERIEEGAAVQFWRQLREHQLPFFQGPRALWRLALPATTPPLSGSSDSLIEWGGALRWVRGDAAATGLAAQVRAQGASALCFRSAEAPRQLPLAALSPELMRVHAGLKQCFDPHAVFNRGLLAAAW